MGDPEISQEQMIDWYYSVSRPEYRASVPIEELVSLYYYYGALEGVAADRAFVQAVLETGSFHFPDGACVLPEDNNFAGLGAWSNCWSLQPRPVWEFESAADGVLAHIIYLRAYADPNAQSIDDLSALPVTSNGRDFARQWSWIVNSYRERGGPWETWEELGSSGWATDPSYWRKLDEIYTSITD
jgi:hypothetical protein